MKTLKISAGDFAFDLNGSMEEIEGSLKVAQDIAEYALKELENKSFNDEQEVRNALSSAISKLKAAQVANTQLTDEEIIKDIEQLFVVRDKDDPTLAYFVLDVSLESGETITRLYNTEDLTDLTHLLEGN